MPRIAIVTGASSGLGRQFVRQLDEGAGGPLDQIWLVARSAGRLGEVAGACHTPCRTLPLDLTDPASFDVLREALDAQPATEVAWLVNSAGFGRFGTLGRVSARDSADMVRLNCIAVVETCRIALGHMGPGSRIVNVSSIAGIAPQPELSVYSATKRFVLDLTRTLDYELRGTGIRCCAVCPKFMDTGFLDRAGDARAVRRMTTIGFEDPARVARRAVADALRGRVTCVPSWDMKAVHVACKLLPSRLVLRVQDALFTVATRGR